MQSAMHFGLLDGRHARDPRGLVCGRHHVGWLLIGFTEASGLCMTEPSAVTVTESSAESFAGFTAGAITVPVAGTFTGIHVWAA